MLGEAIAAQALGHAGLRDLASEHGGPRPAAVRKDDSGMAVSEERTARPEADGRSPATRP